MSAPRHVIALNLGLDETDDAAWRAVVREASRLAGEAGTALHIATLDPLDETAPAGEPPALPRPATWWRFRHGAARDGADAAVQLGGTMRRHEGLPHDVPVLVLLPAGAEAEAAAARLAARGGGVTLGRCLSLALDADGVQATRASHGGKLRLALRTRAHLCFATWRGGAGRDADSDAGPGALPPTQRRILLNDALSPAAPRETLPSADAQAPLAGARIVVSGGRGMQGDEGFALLGRVAARLGAALGGSLPAVDAGWLPVARQIGQSGKFVAPRIYLAVGISGTLQHLAGVSPASKIVAINNDPEAPIFGVAEVGVVADWRDLLPRLVAHLDQPPA